MKSMFKVSLLAASILLVAGCQEEAKKSEVAEQTQTAETAKTVEFKTEDDKAAYAIGVSFANYLSTSLEKPKEFGVELNKDLVLKGIEHAFKNKSEMTEEESRKALENFDKRLNDLAKAKATEKAEAAKKAGDDFRAEFAKQDGVKKTDTGLLYQVITKGTGASPSETDTVQVHYKGTLTDGTQFDSSYDRGEPATFPLNRVIAGWTEGLQLMKEGAKFKFVIPPELAYGKNDTAKIPANSTLVFEVELLKVEKAKPAKDAAKPAEKANSTNK